MKNILAQIVIIFSLGFINLSYSQDFWEQLYFPDTADIFCITTNDLGDIFIGTGGSSGGIYKSIDNGQTWDMVLDIGNFAVYSIGINAQGHLYAGKGGFDRFILSINSGETWETISIPTISQGNISRILCGNNDSLLISSTEDGGGLLLRSPDRGVSWDSLFYSNGNPGDHITDIVVTTSDEIYVSIMGYFLNTGGIFKSPDNGINWEFIGLHNHQVNAMAINQEDDLFTGDWFSMGEESSGIYAQYNNSDSIELLKGTIHVTDIAINSEEQIFVSNGGGILRSSDNGLSFEYINEGISGTFKKIHIDDLGYVYLTKTNSLYRSINPTVLISEQKTNLEIGLTPYPNPTTGILNLKLSQNNTTIINTNINIYDFKGKIVKSIDTDFRNNRTKIDVNELKQGVYFVQIFNQEIKVSSIFIKR